MSFRKAEANAGKQGEGRQGAAPVCFEHADGCGSVFLARAGEGPTVVLVHGSPGSWDSFAHLLSDETLASQFTLVAVDRPGFGKTRPKAAEPSIAQQARRIGDAVVASGVPLPAIWVGHSLGGAVVARLAVDAPDLVGRLLLVAPSVDPALEKRRWFNWAGRFPLARWSLPRAWRNSNDEIWTLKGELERLRPRLGALRIPTVVLHGNEDRLVPKGNADYVKQAWPEGFVDVRIVAGAGHLLPWRRPGEIRRALRDLRGGL